ncbi:unnamed protein product, partial [Porites lobata]
MPTSTYITLVIIYTLEAVLIVFGNAFTIFSLIDADLLVGITELLITGTVKSHNVGESYGFLMRSRANPIAAFILFFSGASVYFLALISMERAFAVLRPIRHRITNSRVYNCSIVIVWAVGLVVFGLTVLSFHYSDLVEEYVFLPFRTCLLISFLIICVSYLSIRTRLRAPPPAELDNHRHRSREHNLRFSKTVFIAIASSLVFWMPAFVVYSTREFCQRCFLHHWCFGLWMPVSGKFYGESSRVQFQNANFQRRFTQI